MAASPLWAVSAGIDDATSVPAMLDVVGLSKRFGGAIALDGVTMSVRRGSIHAVIGENGAGKSTLMKILAGVVARDSGEVRLSGETVDYHTPIEAQNRGIAIVHQELSMLPTRNVLANLFVNNEPLDRFGMVSRRKMIDRARPVLAQLGLDNIDLDRPVRLLPIADRQLIEIARALISNPRILFLDEPNSALNRRETQRLFEILRRLSQLGITMLYVSHRLEEVLEICDTITVMRNARVIFTRPAKELTVPELVDAMLGRRQEELFPTRPSISANVTHRLEVSGLSVRGSIDPVSFNVTAGEVIGVAGLEGSGAEVLLPVLFGILRPTEGKARFPDGGELPADPLDAARRQIAYIPPDRRRQGLMLDRPISNNAAHVVVGALGRRLTWLSGQRLDGRASTLIKELGVKAQSPQMLVHQLSGGNQQKIVVGKWLDASPEVILLDDPTRGIDIGAKRDLFALVRTMQSNGKIVLMRSTELSELVGMCDRILIFYQRRLAEIVDANAFDERALLEAINTGPVVQAAR